MWSLYCLPGRLITHLFFLFPGSGSGDITATRRRDESGCAHFIFATLFWIPVGLVGGLFLIAYFVEPTPSKAARGRAQAAPAASASAAFATATRQALDIVGLEDARTPSNAVSDDEPAPASEPANDVVVNDDVARIAADPRASPKIERAMIKAAETGKPAKWKQGKLRGYAVPSEEAVGGCRMVQVSINSARDVTIEPVQLCGEAQ